MISACRTLFALFVLLALSSCADDLGTPQYYLSGTVSGLKATGLVLAVNGTQVAVPAGSSGSFSQQLSTSLASGSIYTVSVSAQPAGQTCSVAGGSGTIGSADVANVVVTCSDLSFSLGGSVTGLSVSGLVLANGLDTVAVPQGATTFTFHAAVAYSSSYNVTVQSQPSGLACAVTDGSGAMPAADVTTVTVTCTDQPFTVGGTVTDSPGFTLVNGNDSLQVPSGTGTAPFTMGQPVPFGSSYDISAQNVPVGQTCTVTHGSDVMGPADVTNVVVTCASQGYTIGGSLSGLSSGDTLVVSNSNGEHATIDPTKSSYTLTNRIAQGGSYMLAVFTQPAGKTCSIANASSSSVVANVVNANITCGPTTHTVGGTISGLHGATGLILQNNGGDSTTINANATSFTMNTGVAENGSYHIMVSTQPTAASVSNATATTNCSVSSGMGPVGSSNVTSVVVTCGNNLRFATSGGPYSWTVPTGVSSIDVVATGGGGGGGGGSGPPDGTNSFAAAGGTGGRVSATLAVSGGDQFSFVVGGGGIGGTVGATGGYGGGGGGGGSSNINAGSANQIVAGGGGGAGGTTYSAGGDGSGGSGHGNSPGQGGVAGVGGAGGTSMFSSPAPSGSDGNGGPGGDGTGNSPGSGIAGGHGGAGSGSGAGGAGYANYVSGGGGGGFGGGGGGNGAAGGGGGGSTGPSGANIGVSSGGAEGGAAGTAGSNAAQTDGGTGGDGVIQISY